MKSCRSHLTPPPARGGEYVDAVVQEKTSDSQAFRRLKFWVWFQEHTRPTDLQITLFWAGVIGFCGGLSPVAFRAPIAPVHKIITGSSTPGLFETFGAPPPWKRHGVPGIGGFIEG